MGAIIKSVWTYRFFILSSIKTELKTRFARSKLGGIWMILHPLAMVLIYALILSQIMTAKLPGVSTQYAYPIHILSGIVGWTLFSEVLSRSLNVFIENGELIKKLSFPKLALPIITVGSALINFVLLFIAMYVVFGFIGHFPTNAILWLPVLTIITLGLAVGIGLFFGVLNVFVRDVGQLITLILQFWFWLTPIVYMVSIVPEKYHWLINLNPMTGITLGFNDVLLYDKVPDVNLLIYPSIVAIVMMMLSLFIFRKAGEEMADVL
ncbi:ABC transporter [Vibrio tasmaniensis]|nr:ABC transporter [Vibrio tasmaniensis]